MYSLALTKLLIRSIQWECLKDSVKPEAKAAAQLFNENSRLAAIVPATPVLSELNGELTTLKGGAVLYGLSRQRQKSLLERHRQAEIAFVGAGGLAVLRLGEEQGGIADHAPPVS